MVYMPDWMSKDLLQNALRTHFNDNNIIILGYSSSALSTGENYTTDFFKIAITYGPGENDRRKIALVTKCAHHDEKMYILGKEFEFFEAEIAMYTDILPEMYKCLGGEENLSAKCLYAINDPTKSAIILEDLATHGFKMHARQLGLDLHHCLLVVENIARLHAASVVLHKKNPSLIDKYKEGIFRTHPFIATWVAVGFDALSKACDKWPGYEKYSSKLKAIQDQAIERAQAARQNKPGDFNVLNHGDAWINNFMFSYAPGGKVEGFRFIDFQLLIYGSPLIDLNYFWATSPNIDVRKQHLNTLLHHYHKTLVATLTGLKCPLETVPTEEQLRKEFNAMASYGLIAAITVLPVVAATSRDDATFDNLFGDETEDGFRHDAYNNVRFRKHMEHLLPFFDRLGILD